jgi:histidinol-phosphate/aromatic aminotransferase/cobyric acid decarboxylase-like protein
MPEYIRVTVGTEDENKYFLQKLSEVLSWVIQ